MKFRARWRWRNRLLSSVPFLMFGMGCAPPPNGVADGDHRNENENTADVVERIFPADYEETFDEVSPCHPTPSHGGAHTRTFANDAAVEAYSTTAGPFPLGSIVVKVEYSAPGCAEEDLTGWAAIQKDVPGSNSDAGDWRWQLVLRDIGVLHNDEATCIGCHGEAQCVARDFTCHER